MLKIVFIPVFLFLTISLFSQSAYVNFAEALQKSLYFYDANKCNLSTQSRLEWRGPCHMRDYQMPLDETSTNMSASFISANMSALDPDGNGSLDLSGGYHDAGDHVKFGLPQGYTASTLGWGLYEFKQSFIEIGSYDHMIDILKYFTDYFLRCTFKDSSGNVVAFCYQVGDGAADHVCWCAPELWYELSTTDLRPCYMATAETPASDMCAEAAAALAIMYFNYQDIDQGYAQDCLDTAIALYEFGVANRGMGFSGGFYGSGYDHDELSWAAAWLYAATGEISYIDDIMRQDENGAYTGFLSRIVSTPENDWQNAWVHCWDAVWAGVWVTLAKLFPEDSLFDYYARWNIEYWSGGHVPHESTSDSNYLNYTPAGYGMINSWGSARYNTAAQLCGLVYAKSRNRTDIAEWARGQMTYIMGANPLNRSYIVGYSDNHAEHPHHRAAHGSLKNDMNIPAEHKHMLWGALVGGPDGSDNHDDITTDYSFNEVAIDYNAAFVGALAGLYEYFGSEEGHQPLSDFPPPETDAKEYFIEAKIESENKEGIELKFMLHIEPCLPPRLESGFEARYYMDIDEILNEGGTISLIKTQVYYDEQGMLHGGPSVVIEPPVAVDEANGLYYVPINWGVAEMVGQRELQFVIQISQVYYGGENPIWDGTNDFSYQGLGSEYAETTFIPIYHNGVRVFGQSPTDDDPTPTPTPAPTETPDITPETGCDYALGDVNGNGSIDIVDALLVAQYYVGIIPSIFEECAADVTGDGTINIVDALLIAQCYVGLISCDF